MRRMRRAAIDLVRWEPPLPLGFPREKITIASRSADASAAAAGYVNPFIAFWAEKQLAGAGAAAALRVCASPAVVGSRQSRWGSPSR